MCDFQRLAFNENGYIVRCLDCGHYQVGFGTTMLTLSETDFAVLFKQVQQRLCNYTAELVPGYSEETKSVAIATHSAGINMILNKKELQQLHDMLDDADNEVKAISLLDLFNS